MCVKCLKEVEFEELKEHHVWKEPTAHLWIFFDSLNAPDAEEMQRSVQATLVKHGL
jgi:hypothetical protein